MIDEKALSRILQSREARSDKQKDLISKFNKNLISFTLNIPGNIKDSEVYRNIHKEGMKVILDNLKHKSIPIIYKEEIQKSTGSEGYIVVDLEPLELKRMAIDIEENHFLGRIFDIDVFDFEYNQISRADLGADPRGCLLCNKEARICIRERNHTYEELINKIYEMWQKYDDI